MKFVEENIKYHLPESFADCRFEAGKQMCLIVSEGNSPDAIRLHLEEVYDTFTEDRNIFSALEFIAKNVEEAWSVTGKMDETKEQLQGYINNYEEAKKHLQIVLSDPDVESVLANSVVTQVGAFNAQYRLLLDSFNLESEMSVHVTKNMLDKWGVTAEQFIKRTDGNFDVINIPVDQKLRLGANAYPVREFENLKESGVRFMEMPDLNKEDHYVQLAVCKEDREIFDAWFGRYLGNKMSGGEKTIDSLLAFTERKTSIFSVPFEGKEDIFRTDFDAMKINYTVMPDLKLGDGQVQIMVANYDTDKVRQWYELYQQSMLIVGKQ